MGSITYLHTIITDNQRYKLIRLPLNNQAIIAGEFELGTPGTTKVTVGELIVHRRLPANLPSRTGKARYPTNRTSHKNQSILRIHSVRTWRHLVPIDLGSYPPPPQKEVRILLSRNLTYVTG